MCDAFQEQSSDFLARAEGSTSFMRYPPDVFTRAIDNLSYVCTFAITGCSGSAESGRKLVFDTVKINYTSQPTPLTRS